MTFQRIDNRGESIEPWQLRAGMEIVATDWDHGARHLHCTVRPHPR